MSGIPAETLLLCLVCGVLLGFVFAVLEFLRLLFSLGKIAAEAFVRVGVFPSYHMVHVRRYELNFVLRAVFVQQVQHTYRVRAAGKSRYYSSVRRHQRIHTVFLYGA